MDFKVLKELEWISQQVGRCPDQVQGGGGNTSAKLDHRYMAVKASGYRLDQVTERDGYVIVDYQKIRDYFLTVDTSRDIDYEKESTDFIRACVLENGSPKNLRPSIETGFHSFMGKYVIHTHSVYGNILCCAREGREIAERIFSEGFAMLWVPYINPGFDLTIELNKAMDEYKAKNGCLPKIVFMENHGVIVSEEKAESCHELNDRVNMAIKEYFAIEEEYPEIKVEKIGENLYKSRTEYLSNFLRTNPIGNPIGPEFFREVVLYPDQLVYLGDNISFEGKGKVNIDVGTGDIVYATNDKEAITIEETFTAYIYVVKKIKELRLSIQTMSEESIAFIKNMEGEKYRKSLLKK